MNEAVKPVFFFLCLVFVLRRFWFIDYVKDADDDR